VSGHAKPILVGQEEAELEKIGKDQMSHMEDGASDAPEKAQAASLAHAAFGSFR
jgi:hypothetical protein